MNNHLIKADLHLHSMYSSRPSEWFLKKLGASESYSKPEDLYKLSVQRGMDFVTITDHNEIRGSMELKEKYPENVITGVESTVYFPEDGCKVHILVYGLNYEQFRNIQKVRTDIYSFREFIKEENLAYSVAHATYSVNGKLTKEHLEKLILLFDVFEVRNGSRSELHNNSWLSILGGLTEHHINDLYARYRIEPISDNPWVKGFTGGSDDHAGLFAGKTYTVSKETHMDGFLENIKNKKTMASGRTNNFQGLVFAIYKIACDFARQKNKTFKKSSIQEITSLIFEKSKLSFRDKIKLSKMKSKKKSAVYKAIAELVESIQSTDTDNIDKRLDLIYEKITDSTDQIFKILLKSFDKGVANLDIVKMGKSASSAIPGIFITMPFYTSFKHMYAGKEMIENLKKDILDNKFLKKKNVLWFTDTINDLNGVSITLQTIAKKATEMDSNLMFVATLKDKEIPENLPGRVKIIPSVHNLKMPYYSHLEVKIPSMLRLLKFVYEYNPDEIYISTPGPMGLAGLLIANLLNIKCTGIYHTDFACEVNEIAGDKDITDIVDTYTDWFFLKMDKTLVPTNEYMQKLENKGFSRLNLDYFNRGIETDIFKPYAKYKENKHFKLLYVGRISKDKNMDFLIEFFEKLQKRFEDVKLEIVGDGPYFKTLYKKVKRNKDITLMGKIEYKDLPEIYNSADLLAFPSVTDTFGMAVLEAQACGIPALVSNIGGPQEIVKDGETGFVAPVDKDTWVNIAANIIEMKKNNNTEYLKLKTASRNRVIENYDLNKILRNLLDTETATYKQKNGLSTQGTVKSALSA